jgi:hypothetical protein
MNRNLVAKELLAIAKSLMADLEGWAPVRRDVDVGLRNVEVKESLTSYAPRISALMRKEATNFLARQDFRVSPGDLNREWSEYLSLVDPERNANKYHYYVVYSFKDDMGVQRFIALNCSGRIGIVERAYDLTDKYMGGVQSSLNRAQDAAERHMSTKLSKGYQPVPMVRG